MEPNLSGNQNDKTNTRNTRDADQLIIPKANQSADGLPKDPVYNERGDANKSRVSESYEGFSGSNAQGASGLGSAEGFGSNYQMPGADMSDNFQNRAAEGASASARSNPTAGAEVPVGFVDLQTTVNSIQTLVQRIRENLQSTEQAELEALLMQGTQLLTANWKQLSSTATSQVSTLKSDVKENPYRTLITALKVGMALGQVISATRSHGLSQSQGLGDNLSGSQPIPRDDENLGTMIH